MSDTVYEMETITTIVANILTCITFIVALVQFFRYIKNQPKKKN